MKYGFFLISPSKGQSRLRLIVRHQSARYTKSVGDVFDVKLWHQEAQKCKGASKDIAPINTMITNYTNALNAIEKRRPVIANNKHFWDIVSCELDGKNYDSVDPSAKSLVDYIEKLYIPRFYESKSDSRIKRFEATVRLLRDFEKEQLVSYTFDDVGVMFYRKLEAYFMKENYSVNYFGSIIKIIKQVMREATYVDKITTNEEFRSASFTATAENIDSVYLTNDELDRIDRLVIDKTLINNLYPTSVGRGTQQRIDSYTVAKNLFLIGAYTGLRVSDFKRLTKEHFTDGKITMVTEKTKSRVVIPIHPIVQRIVDDGFDFNQTLSEQKIRKYIKYICKEAGIDEIVEVRRMTVGGVTVERKAKFELVGTHTARRSFATNAYLAGVPTLAIMKITGHTKESTFMKYIRVSQDENANTLASHPFFCQQEPRDKK